MTGIALALAQINATVGDIAGNSERILRAYAQAAEAGAELVITPECSLIGYPPEDLLLMPAFRRRAMDAVHALAEQTMTGPGLIVGSVWEEQGRVLNTALLLDAGRIVHVQPKTLLPNYGVFDEKRVFVPGNGPLPVMWRGHRLGMLVCEDIWQTELAARLEQCRLDLLVVINASPFEAGKRGRRSEIAASAAQAAQVTLAYVNLVGGQDELVFDGGSFVLSAQGECLAQLPEFQEMVQVMHSATPVPLHPPFSIEETLWQAMVVGLRDYVEKNGFPGIVLGLSGGIDSAVAAAVAVDALGSGRVRGVLLPSPYTSEESNEDARDTAGLLGIETITLPISPGMAVFEDVLSPVFKDAGWMENPLLGGNLQARLRGISLMAISNYFGWMVLNTSNKSEIAVGYSTLYGDSCGGFAVLKDLYKTQVYGLARWRNRKNPVIPERSIGKPPSAELEPGQKDEDQLPPYGVLDPVLYLHIEGRLSAEEIIAAGHPRELVERMVTLVRQSEYKRRQSCPGVKLSPMLLGRERRFPLTNKF